MIASFYDLKRTVAMTLTVFAGLIVFGAYADDKSKEAFPWVELGKKSGESPQYTAEVDSVNTAPKKTVVKVGSGKNNSVLDLDKKAKSKISPSNFKG